MRRAGFTLVEGILATALAALMMTGIVTFFGDFLQRFSQQDDTLSGAHEAQLLLEWLRRDLGHADGLADDPVAGVSSASMTGTTFPKYWTHVVHATGSAALEVLHWKQEEDVFLVPDGHPAADSLRAPGPAAAATRAQISRVHNAFAWVAEGDGPDTPRFLVINVRNGQNLERVTYTYVPSQQVIQRRAPDGSTVEIASPALRAFSAVPAVEVVHDPDDPDVAPRLVKAWLEVRFEIRAAQEGKKITRRDVGFSTRIFPVFLGQSLKSEWNR